MSDAINLSKQEFAEMMAQAMTAAVRASREPSALEARQIAEQEERDKRRAAMILQLGKIEEQNLRDKKTRCSHRCYPQGHRRAGHACAGNYDSGDFTTSGQVMTDDSAVLVCLRCSTTWRWKPTAQERDFFMNSEHGMLGYTPPAEERCLQP